MTYEGSRTVRLWKPSEELKKQTAGYSETPAASTLRISGQSSPGNIEQGSRWTCKGTITSDYTITHVGGYILQSDNSTIVQSETVKGEYAGTKKVSFTIKRIPVTLTQGMIANQSKIKTVKMQKNGAMPKPKLVADKSTLVEGKDYALSYKNNKQTGTAAITIKGLGNYTGSLTMPFQITAKELTSPDLAIRVPNVAYSGKPNQYQSNPVLTDSDGGILVKNKDYTIEGYCVGTKKLVKSSNPMEGTAITVTLKGTGGYTGTVKATYTLKGTSLSKAVIKIAPQAYTGNHVMIKASDITSATIKDGKAKKTLKLGTDYEIVAYRNNIKKGTATVIFKGIGDYAGEKKVQFKILPTAITGKNGRIY